MFKILIRTLNLLLFSSLLFAAPPDQKKSAASQIKDRRERNRACAQAYRERMKEEKESDLVRIRKLEAKQKRMRQKMDALRRHEKESATRILDLEAQNCLLRNLVDLIRENADLMAQRAALVPTLAPHAMAALAANPDAALEQQLPSMEDPMAAQDSFFELDFDY